MELVKIGKKGQISLPRGILQRLGITGEVPLMVETTEDGAILLRQVGVYPIEMYSPERIDSFLVEDQLTAEDAALLAKTLKK
jgi:AbrB family looped-hinge helix DNA binding protein